MPPISRNHMKYMKNMKRMKKIFYILAIGIMITGLLLISGCIDRDATQGDDKLNESQLRDYFEFEYLGLDNSTTYYLSLNESMKTVIYVTGVTSINVTAQSDMLSKEPLINNIFAMNSGGEVVGVNNSTSKAFGQAIINLRFDNDFTGFVAYTENNFGKRHFSHMIMADGFVRVVLPSGYSTSNPIIGAVRPSGYELSTYDEELGADKNLAIETTDTDRVVVAWDNPYTTSKAVIVNYYPDSAPTVIAITSLLLGFFAICVVMWYRISMKRLKSKQEDEIKI